PRLETAVGALRIGAVDYISKPIELVHLHKAVARGLQTTRLARVRRVALEKQVAGLPAADGDPFLELGFDHALEQLWVAYQPIVTREGESYGYEALLRSRATGFESPLTILAAAEKLKRVRDVETHVHSMAATQAGDEPASGFLFVNVHPQALFDDTLLDAHTYLRSIAGRVVLEITEREALSGRADVALRVQELRSSGFRIAIDDLGAGYAGLTTFAMLEPDIVKIDIGLVRGVDASRTKQKVIASITALSHDLGILALAEGVETLEELQALRAIGCDLFQGYLLGRPAPPFSDFRWPVGRDGSLRRTGTD
ncbi:MAG: EAL domain-containing protein, partial [Deltaproteobacteria bacterium]